MEPLIPHALKALGMVLLSHSQEQVKGGLENYFPAWPWDSAMAHEMIEYYPAFLAQHASMLPGQEQSRLQRACGKLSISPSLAVAG